MKNIYSLFKLIRYPNLVFIILTQCGVQYFIILPALHEYGLESNISPLDFSLLVLSTVLIAAAGYIINDYFDVQIDRINKPERVYIDKTVSRRYAILLHSIFSGTAVLIGIYLAWRSHNIKLLLLQPIIVAFLWFYSTGYKKQPVTGNLIVSFLTGFVVIIVGLYQTPLFYSPIPEYHQAAFPIFIQLFFYFIFASLVSMMREIVKDMEDMHGDEQFNSKTLPILIGVNYSKLIVYALAIIVFALIMLVERGPFLRHDNLTVIYLMQTLQLPLAIATWLLFNADSSKQFRKVSTWIKLLMLMGILTMAYFYYLIR
jgi:4-hydroxybenzoate polyprenyltransferase